MADNNNRKAPPPFAAAGAASPNNPQQAGDEASSTSQPSFRFARMQNNERAEDSVINQGAYFKHSNNVRADDSVINKGAYFKHSNSDRPPLRPGADIASAPAQYTGPALGNWVPGKLRTVPAFYPLEKSSRLVEDDTAVGVASRVAECLRQHSIHAVYDNEAATAALLSLENVEMHLSLWKTPNTSVQQGVLVELQRRKGDSIAFHQYCRHILDAAVGLMEDMPDDYEGAGQYHSRKVQRLLQTQLKNQEQQEHENAVIAIEIAHGLLMKDRMDARQLGLESLCLLTDPRKTGLMTAILAAHVVLLGSTAGVEIPGVTDDAANNELIVLDEGPFQEIREAILGLVQFSRIGEDYMDEDSVAVSPDAEHMTLLHNLALAVLANALDVMENPDKLLNNSEHGSEDSKPRSRLRTASSNDVANEFLQATEEASKKDLLATLIAELGKASYKPHNATLSAKCIGSLCRASEDARRRLKELGAKNVVNTALDVGVRSHRKLETECKKVVQILTLSTTTTPTNADREQDQNDR